MPMHGLRLATFGRGGVGILRVLFVCCVLSFELETEIDIAFALVLGSSFAVRRWSCGIQDLSYYMGYFKIKEGCVWVVCCRPIKKKHTHTKYCHCHCHVPPSL